MLNIDLMLLFSFRPLMHCFESQFVIYELTVTFIAILALSLRSGGCCKAPPPFRIFPRAVFAFLLGLPFGQYIHPLSRCPCIYEKKLKKNCRVKSWGEGGVAQQLAPPPPPRPESEGLAAKISKFS